MKGAQAYVNDQWNTCGLSRLPQDAQAHTVTLHFIVPRDTQYTDLLQRIADEARSRLCEAYPGRTVTCEPIAGSVIGDGSGDGINLHYRIGPADN
ncbi:hypothetical protein JQR85_11880 [Stutzerimonas urumqiensis]|uniref:hypothetical protein n=1 Tax=Stutzerimonas urumqiensis TaxID=638269 RepID=UPI003DA543B2